MNDSSHAPTTMHLPFTPSSVSVARQRLNSYLSDLGGSGESIEDARLVISELVANSVRHAQPLEDGSIVVSWVSEDDGLQVSVTDGGGGTTPRNVHASATDMAGRGMTIVDVLSQRWWTESTNSDATVHALLSV